MLENGHLRHVFAAVCLLGALGSWAACGASLGALGDDCALDTDCNSGLCDDKNYCATPVDATDGQPCTTDATCPAEDHCHVATGKCFSNASDGLGGNNACNTQSDCSSDEVCTNHVCQG